jgi:predicted nucleic acid-binding protein
LADSSVLIDVFRARRTPASDRLREAVRQGTPYAVPLPCVQEVLQGARDEPEWRLLRKFFESQEIAEPADGLVAHVEAARIFFDCRRRGLTVRSSVDCLIAALAIERRDILLHDDDDFEAIAKVRPLRTLRS